MRNRSIQGLRGLGAITVFIWHTHWYIDSRLGFDLTHIFRGDFANPMFFMLAGFFVGINYSADKIVITKFVINKLKRIYPLYFFTVIMTLGYLVYDGSEIKFSSLIPHFFLIQSWIPGYLYENALNGPAWFLSMMVFLWIMTKLIIKIVEKITYTRNGLFFLITGLFIIFSLGTYTIDRYNLISILPEIVRPYNYVPYILGIILGKRIEKFSAIVKESVVIDGTIILSFCVLLILRQKLNRVYSFTLLLLFLLYLIAYLYVRGGRIEWDFS